MRRFVTRALPALLLAATAGACATTSGIARPSPFPNAPASSIPVRMTGLYTPPNVLAILDTAMALRGIPYVYGGDVPSIGFDCSGFVHFVFEQHQLLLPRTAEEQFQVGRKVRRDRVEPGDLIFFTTEAPGASHVGIAIDRDTFVHAPGSGSVIRTDRIDATYWQSRLVGVKRVL